MISTPFIFFNCPIEIKYPLRILFFSTKRFKTAISLAPVVFLNFTSIGKSPKNVSRIISMLINITLSKLVDNFYIQLPEAILQTTQLIVSAVTVGQAPVPIIFNVNLKSSEKKDPLDTP